MSIILDALRRGRAQQTLRADSNAARTDAVLHTLGYGRFNRASAGRRLQRFFGYLFLGSIVALVLWGASSWIIPGSSVASEVQVRAPFSPPPTHPTATSVAAARPQVVDPAPAAPVASAEVAPKASVSSPPAASRNASAFARKPENADKPDATSVPDPGAPAHGRPLVGQSRRAAVPESLPPAPVGAPSNTAMSTLAGTNSVNGVSRDEYFRRAVVAQRLGDFENALFNYKLVLQRDDLNIEAYNNLGLLYRDKGLLDDAAREFLRALAISPGYARARNNLGVVYLNQRKLDDAAAQFHSALAVDPKNVESLVNLSIVEKQSGRRDAARTALVRALEIDPRNAEAYYNFGVLEDESGIKDRALAHYRAFLQYGAATHPRLVGEVRRRVQQIESEK